MSKRVLQINAYVLSLTPVVEKGKRVTAAKAIGFCYQQKCRHVFLLSFTPVVFKKNSKEGSSSNKAIGFLHHEKCRLSPNVVVIALESINLL